MKKLYFHTYASAFQSPGGGEILLLKLKEYLEKRDIKVKLFDPWRDQLDGDSILHVFGSVKECLGLMEAAKARGTRIVMTPIFWSSWRRALFMEGSIRGRAGQVVRHAAKVFFPAFPSSRRKMFLLSDLLLPNSDGEARAVARYFAISSNRFFVVPNGVDSRFEEADGADFRKKFKLDKFILSVGRIEPRKNQLRLIRAARRFPLPLVLVGEPVATEKAYYEQCLREADGKVQFLGGLDHDSVLLSSAYAGCEVFVLQGHFETPGLAALEAALAGAKIAATKAGSTTEYFGGFVDYLDPTSVDSIRRAVERALERPRTTELKTFVSEHHTWDRVVDRLVQAYENVAGSDPAGV